MSRSDLRWIPSVDAVLRALPPQNLPRPLVVRAVRTALMTLRQSASETRDLEKILADLIDALRTLERARIRPVINATGVILHTNLGRAPMGSDAADAISQIATQYNTLEYDIATGERGRRGWYVEYALNTLCESEATTFVNNCAAALMLIVKRLTAGPRKQVLISRGELVQIGGGFRVPEILEASGATLREVGTTNQTNVDDYRRAISDDVAMILKVHRSNFFMDGFVASPTTAELATIAREAGVPLVEDIGSGATFDTSNIGAGASPEPTLAGSLGAGANLICFSGDKLLGGPQAGIIAGEATLVAQLKRDPIFRALRCDKLVLAALQATVDRLLEGRPDAIPIRQMLATTTDELRHRGNRVIESLSDIPGLAVAENIARVGGGSMAATQISSIAISWQVAGVKPLSVLTQLRELSPPVIAGVDRGRVCFDLRTVLPQQDALLVDAIRQVAAATSVKIA